MKEPWNIKQDDNRIADSLPTFIIFCEDEVSEPNYFRFFETSLIKVNPVEGQKSKIVNVFNAIKHCISEELMDLATGVPILKNVGTQVWCVFDRDKEENAARQAEGNIHFNEAIETAKARGLKIAWSNDSFELWILLHFMDVDPTTEEFKSREFYYEKLTEIFKALGSPNEDLVKARTHASFRYKRDLKSKNNFRSIVREEIVGKTNNAIERAKLLEEHHNKTVILNHEKAPCTLVHHLVQELLLIGKKEI